MSITDRPSVLEGSDYLAFDDCKIKADMVAVAKTLVPQALDSVELPDFVSSTMRAPAHKWRISSAWQKAIRRGDVQVALRMASALDDHDPSYIPKRAATVLLEDIAHADPLLLATFMPMLGHLGWIAKEFTTRQFALKLTYLMCLAVKSRATCDLAEWIDCAVKLSKTAHDMVYGHSGLPLNELSELACNPHADPHHRGLALWSFLGTKKYPGGFAPPNIGGSAPEIVSDLVDNGLPAWAKVLFDVCGSKMSNNLPVAWLSVELALHSYPDVTVRDPLHPRWEPAMIGNYPDYTFEYHCAEGKSALRYMVAACEPLREYFSSLTPPITDKPGMMMALSCLVFRSEAGFLSKALSFHRSETIQRECELVTSAAYGIPVDRFDQGMALLHANRASLDYARRRVLNVIPSGSTKPKMISMKDLA